MNAFTSLVSEDEGSAAGPIRAMLHLIQAHTGGGAALLVRRRTQIAEVLDSWPERGQTGQTLPLEALGHRSSGSQGTQPLRLPLAYTLACGRRPKHVDVLPVRPGELELVILCCSDNPPDAALIRNGARSLAALARSGQLTATERSASARAAAMVQSLPIPFVFVDEAGSEVFINSRARTLLGLAPREQSPGPTVRALTKLVSRQGGAPLQRALAGDAKGAAVFALEHEGRTLKVETRWIEDGPVSGRVWTFFDITAERALEDELRLLASTDFLTGALNRRAFDLTLRSELERCRRYALPLTAIMLDLDHFKRVNDTYGHEAGDEVLRCTRQRIQAVLRNGDVLARIGGEEFALLLPHTAPDDAEQVAERVRVAIQQEPVRVAAFSIAVTASLGLAGLEGGADDRATLMERADTALYQAKQSGRNRVCRAEICKPKSVRTCSN